MSDDVGEDEDDVGEDERKVGGSKQRTLAKVTAHLYKRFYELIASIIDNKCFQTFL